MKRMTIFLRQQKHITMNRFLTSTLLLALPALVTIMAQKPPIKWGEVPAEDLTMAVYPADTSAAAVVLADFGEVTFDFKSADHTRYHFERHRRVKILKRSAFDLANVTIKYYSKDHSEKLVDLKAHTIGPDGKIVAVRKQDVFEESVDGRLTLVKFSLSDVREGSVIEYRYRISSNDLLQLPEWYFQEDIPVRWSEYRLHIPEFYHYVIISWGRPPDIFSNEYTTESIPFRSRSGAHGTLREGRAEAKIVHYRMAMKEAPALKEEDFITTMDDYLARVRLQLSATKFDQFKPVLSTWEELAKDMREHRMFGQQLHKIDNFNMIMVASEALPLEGTLEDKTRALYTFLNERMTWNGRYDVLARDNLNTCFKRGSGSGAELNLMLVALLRARGIEAKPVLISTRDNGRPTESYPIIEQFNHVLALAVLEKGKLLFLDLGDLSRPPGMLHVNALNRRGWISDPNQPIWIDLPAPENTAVTKADLHIDTDGRIEGWFRRIISGYDAIEHFHLLRDHQPKEIAEKWLRQFFPNAVVDTVDIEKKSVAESAITYSFQCRIPTAGQSASTLIYFNPVLTPAFSENPFRSPERNFPIEAPYTLNEQYTLKLSLPNGYELDDGPKPLNLTHDKDLRYSFNLVNNDDKQQVEIVSRLWIRRTRFEPEEYPSLREFFVRMIEKQQEPAVLRKRT
jgi:transglutaminase-like putative cysteine protease